MRLSSGFGVVEAVGLPGAQQCVEDVDAAAGECDDGLVVSFSFASFAAVEGAAGGVLERAEGGLVEDALDAHTSLGVPVDGATEEGDAVGRTLARQQLAVGEPRVVVGPPPLPWTAGGQAASCCSSSFIFS